MNYCVEEELILLAALELMYPQSTKTKLRKMLTEGRVLVDGEPVYKAKKLLAKGNLVSVINRSEAMIKSPPPEARKQFPKLKIIFEDQYILVVDKPAGLLSVATEHGHAPVRSEFSFSQWRAPCRFGCSMRARPLLFKHIHSK